MIECEREQVVESLLDERLAVRAAAGWRLVSAVPHPFLTEEAAPKWVTIWERVT